MKISCREKRTFWGIEYYVKEWCCNEFKEDIEDYDIDIVEKMVEFSTCEDEGVRHFPFRFKYCPCCGKKITIKYKPEPTDW